MKNKGYSTMVKFDTADDTSDRTFNIYKKEFSEFWVINFVLMKNTRVATRTMLYEPKETDFSFQLLNKDGEFVFYGSNDKTIFSSFVDAEMLNRMHDQVTDEIDRHYG